MAWAIREDHQAYNCVDNVCIANYFPCMTTGTRSARIDLRLDPYKKSVVIRAAELLGVNITQFIMDRVFPEAEKIVLVNQRIRLSKADWERFCKKLDEPPKNLPKLRKLLAKPGIFTKG